jgi:anti-anti-sigma factor
MGNAKQMKKLPRLKLEANREMTIYQAAEMKPILFESLDKAVVVEMDLSAVAEIDTAGVQLLLMMKKAAAGKQCELKLFGHSPAVLEVFELTNLAGFFGDPLVMQSSGKAHASQHSTRSANES